jgi:hypothetical protein
MLADPKILRIIINDPGSTEVERAEAKRVLGESTDPSPPSQRRRSRNANVPMTQADQDADLNSALTFRSNDGLTSSDRIEITAGMDDSTRAILAAYGSSILWLFQNNAAEIQTLIDLHARTQSDFVREKTIKTIRWIADYSPIEAAKTQAKEFLDQLDHHQGETKP